MYLVHVMREEFDTYIGRADNRIGVTKDSIFCNKFRSADCPCKAWAVERYRIALRAKLRKKRITRSDFRNKLLGRRAACWCADDVCHGLVLQQCCDHFDLVGRSWINRCTYYAFVLVDPNGKVLDHQPRFHQWRKQQVPEGTTIYGVWKRPDKKAAYQPDLDFGILEEPESNEQFQPLFVLQRNLFGGMWQPHEDYSVKF